MKPYLIVFGAVLLAAGISAGLLFVLPERPQAVTQATEPLALHYPSDCRIGEACWIFSFADLDPGQGYTDHQCGLRSYEGHRGTDIALLDALDQRDHPVRAAAPGRVLGVRDGETDNIVGQEVSFPEGRDCGNGVRIDHGDGWITQYCHLKQGSVSVQAGDVVQTGSMLGAIGNSGRSETPHLHFQVELNGLVVDPFTGQDTTRPGTCGTGTPLWTEPALTAFGPYGPTFIRHAGFSDRPIEVRDAQALETPETLSSKAEALIFYATHYGVAAGSKIRLEVRGPDGALFVENDLAVEEDRARRFDFVGRRTPADGWPSGRYTGTVTYGEGASALTRTATVLLE